MKIKRILNENDIKRIVADYFRTRAEKVSISVKKQSEGYGQGEHIVDCVEIEINEERECPITNLVHTLPTELTTVHG